MSCPRSLLPAALVLVILLQWGSPLEVAAVVDDIPEDCAPRQLRCELLCHVVELSLQCAKCRSRAPVRFGKRTPESAETPLQAHDQLCCGNLLTVLLRKAAAHVDK
ncbi:hypothetical protein C0J52_01549 [Blattella germanica]|nr:hypothetical protein C0J52_01549 [Blattella germanica]